MENDGVSCPALRNAELGPSRHHRAHVEDEDAGLGLHNGDRRESFHHPVRCVVHGRQSAARGGDHNHRLPATGVKPRGIPALLFQTGVIILAVVDAVEADRRPVPAPGRIADHAFACAILELDFKLSDRPR